MALRLASDDYGRQVLRSQQSAFEVESWLGAQSLGRVDVVTGTWQIEDTEDAEVPGSVQFSVPNTPEWRPVVPDHPLARMGQELQVRAGITSRTGAELLSMGRFRITDVEPNGEVLDVTGQGLLVNVKRARFLTPFTVAAGTTRQTALRRMFQGILPVAFEVEDETMPAGAWERERIEAAHEIVQAWPARLDVDDTGTVVVGPAWDDDLGPDEVEHEWRSGSNLQSLQPGTTPEKDFNAYAVSTVPEGDEAPTTGVWKIPTGPMRWGGPYGFNPGFYASPVLPADKTRLAAVARSMTERGRRRHETVQVEALPDARVRKGTVVRVVSELQGYDAVGRVTAIQHTRSGLSATVAVSG